ncbi:MAG: hypothetical protein I8H80_01635 [Alphaproteobacteria bacterium]|nr:hypothetical protein [Alphaproteobacteria bacterium]
MMAIITGTPIWVWGILAYIMYVGIQATKERIVWIPKLFIIPIILIALKYQVFLSEHALLSGLSICGGTGLGFWVTTKNSGIILKEISSVKLPGSYITLVFLLSFFLLKYVFGYLSSAHNPIAVEYASVDVIVSSVLTGYFLGRGLYYVSRLR